MCGSGRQAPTWAIRDFLRCPAPWASTTANSCAIGWCCAVARRSRLHLIFEARTEISSPRRRAGSFAAYAWRTVNAVELFQEHPGSPMHSLSSIPALPEAAQTPVGAEVYVGLTSRPKTLSPWLFYDAEGSGLFEDITELPEYYLTRTERGIFSKHADEII